MIVLYICFYDHIMIVRMILEEVIKFHWYTCVNEFKNQHT